MPEDGEDVPAPWAPLEADTPPQSPPPPPPPQQQPPPGYPPQPPMWPPPAAYGPPPGPPMWPPPPGWQPAPGYPAPPPLPKAGDARTGPLPLHPMTLSDILDGAFKLFKANVRTVVLITAAFVVPLQIATAFAQRNVLGGRGFVDFLSNPPASSDSLSTSSDAQTVLALVALAVSLLITPFVAGAISRVVAASYLGQEESPSAALRATGRRIWALLAAWILVHLLELIGGLLCILPGLLFMALFVAVAPAIVIEELGPIQGMRRSWRLTRRRIWSVLGIALLAGFLANVLGQVLGFVPTIIALVIGLEWAWPLLAAGGILSSLVTTPFVAIVATLLYFDGRIRQEGFDLQLMADALARPPAA